MKILYAGFLTILILLGVVEGAELELNMFLSSLCDEDMDQFNFISVKSIELDGEGKSEYIALHQGNNFTEHYYFSVGPCGYSVIKTNLGESLASLGSGGGFTCAPHGCFAVVRCRLSKGSNHFSILELQGTEHAAVLMTGELEGYEFSSTMTETMFLYKNGIATVLWRETKRHSAALISELQSSQRFQGCG